MLKTEGKADKHATIAQFPQATTLPHFPVTKQTLLSSSSGKWQARPALTSHIPEALSSPLTPTPTLSASLSPPTHPPTGGKMSL